MEEEGERPGSGLVGRAKVGVGVGLGPETSSVGSDLMLGGRRDSPRKVYLSAWFSRLRSTSSAKSRAVSGGSFESFVVGEGGGFVDQV